VVAYPGTGSGVTNPSAWVSQMRLFLMSPLGVVPYTCSTMSENAAARLNDAE